jgi:peptidoglycan/LPS O-acetylase OafA/YrhL
VTRDKHPPLVALVTGVALVVLLVCGAAAIALTGWEDPEAAGVFTLVFFAEMLATACAMGVARRRFTEEEPARRYMRRAMAVIAVLSLAFIAWLCWMLGWPRNLAAFLPLLLVWPMLKGVVNP